MLISVNNRLERYTGHCVSFCTHPGEGTARGKWRGCATGRRGDMGTWVWKKKQRRDKRTQPQAQKPGWHCFFLIYTSSPGDFITSMALGINCNGWFLCLYTQPWKLGLVVYIQLLPRISISLSTACYVQGSSHLVKTFIISPCSLTAP